MTTYRIDGTYEDGRHPTEVTFTANLKEDLRRRDFTINAMAYNDRSGLVDLYGGLADMENRVIRCVGDAGERFDEDALRMLRAVRFSAQLGYRIDEATGEAVRALAPNLQKISAERIQAELVKLVTIICGMLTSLVLRHRFCRSLISVWRRPRDINTTVMTWENIFCILCSAWKRTRYCVSVCCSMISANPRR